MVTAASLLASLLNPYGYELHLHVYRYLSSRWLMNHIDEFLSPNFHGVAQQCFVAILLIAIVVLAAARNKPSLSRVLVLLFATYSGLYASRESDGFVGGRANTTIAINRIATKHCLGDTVKIRREELVDTVPSASGWKGSGKREGGFVAVRVEETGQQRSRSAPSPTPATASPYADVFPRPGPGSNGPRRSADKPSRAKPSTKPQLQVRPQVHRRRA